MSALLLEDGSALLLEDGSALLLETPPVVTSRLFLEDGNALLLEDGSYLLLETSTAVTPTVTQGGGTPVRFHKTVQKKHPVLTPARVRIVGHATAILGPFEAHATAIVTRNGVARSDTRTVELASEGELGWRLRRLQRERDDLETLWLLDGDDLFFIMLDDVVVEIERLGGTQGPQ